MAISWLSPQERGLAIGAFAAGAIAQAGLAFAQLANGGPLGLNGLGEFADPLLKAHDSLVPRGTMYHPYILAGFAALAGCLLALQGVRSPRPAPWLAAAALAVSPVGVAYSRSGPLAVALVCAGLALAARARPKAHAAAIAALVIGVGIPALVQIDGWIAPTRPTLLNGREIFVAENLVLFERSPIVGIGPGRSVIELRRLMGDDPVLDAFLQPVHDVPGLAAVEGGVAAGLAAALLLAVLAWRTRRDALAFAVLGTILPYFLLDHWPYTYAQGLVLTGVWLGMLDARAATPARAPEARS